MMKCMHNAFMPTITIRDVPDDLHSTLEARATANNRSLQGEVMTILQQAVNLDYNGAIKAIQAAIRGRSPAAKLSSLKTIVIPEHVAYGLCLARESDWPDMSQALLIEGPKALNRAMLFGFKLRVDSKATSIFFT